MTEQKDSHAQDDSQHPTVPVDAIVNLVNHQEQCDMDGVMVKVSRQALAEVLLYVTEVRPDNKWAEKAAPRTPAEDETPNPMAAYWRKRFELASSELKHLRAQVEKVAAHLEQRAAAFGSDRLKTAIFNGCILSEELARHAADLRGVQHSSTVNPSGIMAAAANAAKVVEGWSDSKKEYADRVVGASNTSTERQDG